MNETVIIRLELRDFRNFNAVEFHPSQDGLTVIQGENGAGKSSLLEAIVYSSTLQSFRGAPVRLSCARAQPRPMCVVTSWQASEELRLRWRSCPAGVTALGTMVRGARYTRPSRSPADDVVHSRRPRPGKRCAQRPPGLCRRCAGQVTSTTWCGSIWAGPCAAAPQRTPASTWRTARLRSGDDTRHLGRSAGPDR